MGHVEFLQQLGSINEFAGAMNQIIQTGNDQSLFNLSFLKIERKKKLQEHFKTNKIKKIYLTQRTNKLAPKEYKDLVEALPNDFFIESNDLSSKIKLLENSIVIVNNNDTGGQTTILDEVVKHSSSTIFCAWDWDNHHWLNLSCKLAGIVDIYFPAHNDNLYQLSRFNDSATFVTPCGTVQWSEEYLSGNNEKILNANRSDELFGMHLFYPAFLYRTSVVKTVSDQYSTVGFRDPSFHNLTDSEKLNEWVGHKLHLIVPVLNDLPIRMFDAWCTGGIPLVPTTFEGLLQKFNIHENDICYYNATEIINIRDKVKHSLNIFNQEGIVGIQRRHNYGMSRHHGNRRLEDIIYRIKKLYTIKL